MVTPKPASLWLCVLPALVFLALPSARGTDVSGTIAGNTTWTLAGSPYRVVGPLTVGAGVTLTVQPGVTVQCTQNNGIWIDGTLNAVGTAVTPILFTGTTSTPGWWSGLLLRNAGSATLQHCTVECGGYWYGVMLWMNSSGALTLGDCVVRSARGDGLRVASGYSSFTSARNAFSDCSVAVHVNIGASFDDQTSDFSGNGLDVLLDGGTIAGPTVWALKSTYSLYLENGVTIAAGATLTIRPGTVVKVAQQDGLYVDGALDARGTAGAPIHFTDWRDDTVGGDANHDGTASVPAADWWRHIVVRSAGQAVLEWCRIAYAGYWDRYGIHKTGSGDLQFRHSTVAHSSGYGMNVTNNTGDVLLESATFSTNAWSGLYLNSGPVTATGCVFSGNADYGVYHEVNDGIVYADNTFTGNSDGCVGVGGGTMTADQTWTLGLGDPFTLVANDTITVAPGVTLAVSPGVRVRVARSRLLAVDGTLTALGTPAAPIVFTGTGEQAGWWNGIHVRNTGAAALDFCDLAYGGYWDSVGLWKTGTGSLSLTNSTLRDITGDGLRALGSHLPF